MSHVTHMNAYQLAHMNAYQTVSPYSALLLHLDPTVFIHGPWLIHRASWFIHVCAYKTISPRSGLLDEANDCALFVTHLKGYVKSVILHRDTPQHTATTHCALFVTHHKCYVIHPKNVLYVCLHAFMYAWMQVCIYVWRDKQLRSVLYTPQILFMHAYMYVCMYVCMCVCEYVNVDENHTNAYLYGVCIRVLYI